MKDSFPVDVIFALKGLCTFCSTKNTIERFRNVRIHIQIPIRRHFVCSREVYPRLPYFAYRLPTDTGAHTHCKKTDTILQTFSCIFPQNYFHWYCACYRQKIVSHLQAKWWQNAVYKTRIKHGVSIGHVCQKNTHDECKRTQVKHTYILRNKIQHVADVYGYV